MSNSSQERKAIWDALEKRIFELVYGVTLENIESTIVELSNLDMVRGMGLFCKACQARQIDSKDDTDIIAALAAAVNNKFPEVGNLLCRRVVLLFYRALRKNIKRLLVSSAKYIACLVNRTVLDRTTVVDMVMKLIENPIDGSYEAIVHILKECGWYMLSCSPQYVMCVNGHLHAALVDEDVEKKEKDIVIGFLKDCLECLTEEWESLEISVQLTTHFVSVGPEPIDAEDEFDDFHMHPLFREENYNVKMDWDMLSAMKAGR